MHRSRIPLQTHRQANRNYHSLQVQRSLWHRPPHLVQHKSTRYLSSTDTKKIMHRYLPQHRAKKIKELNAAANTNSNTSNNTTHTHTHTPLTRAQRAKQSAKASTTQSRTHKNASTRPPQSRPFNNKQQHKANTHTHTHKAHNTHKAHRNTTHMPVMLIPL